MKVYRRSYRHSSQKGKRKRRMITLLTLLAIIILVVGTVIYFTYARQNSADPTSSLPMEPTATLQPSPTAEPTPTPTPEPTPTLVPSASPSEAVPDSYFDDAVFIGDSRTEGFMLYSGLSSTAASYTSTGLTVDTVFTKPVVKSGEGKITIVDALKRHRFSKIYVMFGVNELGWAYDSIFIEKYQKFIEEIKASQPNAVIYVQSILPVTKKKSESDPIYNNIQIHKYNDLIEKMAKECGVEYLDVAQSVTDESGNLFENASTDGIHLTKEYCEKWLDYLKTHTKEVS